MPRSSASSKSRLAASPAASWASALTELSVPAGVVNDLAGAFAFAESIGLQPIVEIPRDGGAPVRLTRNPIGLSRTPPAYRSAPPRLPDGPADPVAPEDLWPDGPAKPLSRSIWRATTDAAGGRRGP